MKLFITLGLVFSSLPLFAQTPVGQSCPGLPIAVHPQLTGAVKDLALQIANDPETCNRIAYSVVGSRIDKPSKRSAAFSHPQKAQLTGITQRSDGAYVVSALIVYPPSHGKEIGASLSFYAKKRATSDSKGSKFLIYTN